MKILVIDNYDSFTYNLVQLAGHFTRSVSVRRNDRVDLAEVRALAPDRIIISPGPGRPEDSNISLDIIRHLGPEIPVLGVCLGHQSIGICFGARVVRAPYLMHGKISEILHDGRTIFSGLPQNFAATRYHSLIIDRCSVNGNLEISAETGDGLVMGVRHKEYPVEGIQFHPESFLTLEGSRILKNWMEAK